LFAYLYYILSSIFMSHIYSFMNFIVIFETRIK